MEEWKNGRMEGWKVGKGCDCLNGISMGTLSRSLSIPLIARYSLAWGISIALAIHSLDPIRICVRDCLAPLCTM